MAVHAKVFIHESRAGNGGIVLAAYTVPAGRTAVVHDFRMTNEAAGTTVALLGVRRGATICWLAKRLDLIGGTTLTVAGNRIVAEAGDQLVSFTAYTDNTPGYVSVHASGSLLVGVAE